ncbi:MAG TPA: hypothetical protein DCE56_11940 [Cyanobacteria bacterium UBA8553]|nr:hypothetical protein [Cyanobacteria bacterium UBA8553]HAJ58252.1 hypothetical protein [Cyanobacteria bacterium UBA8543]
MNPDSTRYRQSPWLNLLIQQRGLFILAIPVTCLISSLLAFGGLQIKTAQAEYWVQHTQQVRLEGKRLLTALLDAETGVRGYILVRRPEFLEPYQSSQVAIPNSIKKLKQLVADNPIQAQRLQQIQTLVKAREKTLQYNIILANTRLQNVTESPQLESSLLEGKQMMDRTRAQIDQFIAEEERLQTKRDKTLKQQQQLTWIVLGVSAGIGMIGSLFAACLLNRVERKLRERDRKLRESEARYRLLIEHFPKGAVILVNHELRYLVADGAAFRTEGLSRKQLEGKTIWEVWPPEFCATIEPLHRRVLAGTVVTDEISYGDRFFQINGVPLRNERGEIIAGMVVSQDITDYKQAQEQLRESEERYRQLVELCPYGIFIQTQDKFSLVNPATMKLFGATTAEELIGKSIFDLLHPENREIVQERIRQLREDRNAVPLIEEKWFRLDGTMFHAEVAAIPFNYQNELADQVVIRDITKRKQSEQKLNLLNRSLRTLSECNQILVRATEESALLDNICRIIVEYGGYHSAWIGFAEQDEAKTVRPVAEFGFPEGYLNSLEIAWSDTQQGRGPVGTVIRTGQPYISQNILNDETYAPWLNAGTQRGYAASISLPLILDEQPLGSLNIYSVQPDAFNEEEVKLLTELANDLAYGVTALRSQIERQKAEAALQVSNAALAARERQWRTIIDAEPECVKLIAPDGTVLDMNAAGLAMIEADSLQQVLGKSVYASVAPEYREDFIALNQRALLGEPGVLEFEIIALKGTRRWLESHAVQLLNENDQVIGVLSVTRDITARKLAEEEIIRLNKSLERRAVESETRYQQIVELAEEGIWVVDSEAKTIYVNQAMAKLLNYTENEMLGRPFLDFISETDYQSANSYIERQKQGKAEKHEVKLKTKDGQLVWTYISTSPVLDESGQMLWSCTLVYDITERKKAEEQLQKSSERISLANAELARATRLKDEFLASMSHELRTPLNAILGLSEALQEEVYGSLTPKQHKSLATIEQSGKHLLDLINDILDLSKIESGKMELQMAPVSIEELCQASLTFVKQQAHYKQIQLNFKIGDSVNLEIPDGAAVATKRESALERNTSSAGEIVVDERRMRQVLINLLSNAVKFTPDGGEIWLNVEADTEDEVLHFKVIDTGIGIAPENINKLFKPFVQLDSSLSRRYAGTGLGLALVRRIVELHGGSVSLESEPGNGSEFTVTLPWQKSSQMEESSLDREQALVQLLDIHQALIVEDSETAAKQVARYLAEQGTAAYIHPCGEGTVQAALKFKPDVIILDLLLPNISGWEVLQELKANPATQDIPVLVVSVVDERSHALALGASEYLLKPFNRQGLQSALGKIFSNVPQHDSQSALVVMPQEPQQPPLILLAEDNEANISTLVEYLQLHEFRVSLARNGLEAVEIAKQQKPDLILMDIQMPEMDGLEATRLIRAEANLATLPIIALTALAMPGDRERCLGAGATDYLTKPVGLKKLTNLITQYINPVASG